MTDIISKELNYSERKTKVSHGNAKLTKTIPLSGNQSLTLGTADSEVLIELPPSVFNLSKSVLSFEVVVTAPGANNNVLWMTGCSPISRLVLQTRSGQYLCDIPNFAQYMYSSGLITRSLHELLSSDMAVNNRDTAAACFETTNGIQITAVGADLNPAKTLTDSAATSPTAVRYHIPLTLFGGTIFAINKLLYFGEPIQMRVVFVDFRRLGYISTPAVLATGAGISNIALWVAIERDQGITQQIMSLYEREGINLNFPYVYGTKYTNAGGSFSINQRFSKAYGKSLLRAFTANLNATESADTLFTVALPTATTDIRTALNNVFQQDSALNFQLCEPMLFMKDILKDAALQTSAQWGITTTVATAFQSYVDNWTAHNPYERELDERQDGVSLEDGEVIYSVNMTSATASQVYVFTVVQRTLLISRKTGTVVN